MRSDAENDFEAFTGLEPLQRHAIQKCGKEFVSSLTKRKILTRNPIFWQEVNDYLSIPLGTYKQKLEKEQKEREQKLEQERQEREQQEKLRLERIKILKSRKKKVKTKERNGWIVNVFELPESISTNDKFYAECIKDDMVLETPYTISLNHAFCDACNLLNVNRQKEEQLSLHLQLYSIFKPLYLMMLYLSGGDERYEGKLLGINSWIRLDFSILFQLEADKLLLIPQRGKRGKDITYIRFTPKGLEEAIQAINQSNIQGIQDLLESRKHHLEWLENPPAFYDEDEEEYDEE